MKLNPYAGIVVEIIQIRNIRKIDRDQETT